MYLVLELPVLKQHGRYFKLKYSVLAIMCCLCSFILLLTKKLGDDRRVRNMYLPPVFCHHGSPLQGNLCCIANISMNQLLVLSPQKPML